MSVESCSYSYHSSGPPCPQHSVSRVPPGKKQIKANSNKISKDLQQFYPLNKTIIFLGYDQIVPLCATIPIKKRRTQVTYRFLEVWCKLIRTRFKILKQEITSLTHFRESPLGNSIRLEIDLIHIHRPGYRAVPQQKNHCY